MLHTVQAELAGLCEKNPAAQSRHVVFVRAPVELENFPAKQSVQKEFPVDPCMAVYLPVSHEEQEDLPLNWE